MPGCHALTLLLFAVDCEWKDHILQAPLCGASSCSFSVILSIERLFFLKYEPLEGLALSPAC